MTTRKSKRPAEKKRAEKRAEKPRESSARKAGQPRPPRPPRIVAPKFPARPEAPDESTVDALDAAPPIAEDFSTEEPGIPYPMFPNFPHGAIDRVAVYRKIPKPGDTNHFDWKPISMPWSAGTITWELIGEICGGGSFGVVARKGGHMVTSAQKTMEGPSRTPGQRDLYRLSPGLNNGGEISETPGGWVAIPGQDGATQAAFVAFQQTACMARDDASKMQGAFFVLVDRLTEAIAKPDPGLAVLESIVTVQRETIDKLYKELHDIRIAHTKLQIEEASGGREAQKMKLALYQKGLDVIDGAAATIATDLLESKNGVASGSASDLGQSLTKKLLTNLAGGGNSTPAASNAPASGG